MNPARAAAAKNIKNAAEKTFSNSIYIQSPEYRAKLLKGENNVT